MQSLPTPKHCYRKTATAKHLATKYLTHQTQIDNMTQNPLLDFSDLPPFSAIEAEHVLPALETVLSECRAQVELLCQIDSPTWQNFAAKTEDIDEKVSRVWSPVSHLNGVKDSDELRAAYQEGISLLTEYSSEMGQNQALYKQFKTLRASDEFEGLSIAQKKIIENSLLDFRLSGAELPETDQTRLREINQRASELSNQFSRNVLDSTQAWQKVINDESELSGLPQSALDMAAQLASDAGEDGWLFSLQIPSYLAVMQHADNQSLREEMYVAYSTRASEFSNNSEFDNAPLIDEILALKHEKATLLGYEHYAEFSLVKKMAKSSDAVIDFLADLVKYAKPVAQKELSELQAFAAESGASTDLKAWDISYYSEKLREQRYAFNDEQVKPYFPAPQVFDGMFAVVQRLFGIRLTDNAEMDVWNKDVRCFNVLNAKDKVIGRLYADLYVRKHKRGGAWMDTCIHRRIKQDSLQLPVAFLTCNFTPPIGDDPALLTHSEVETLFHEFGHTLHHLLTQVDEMGVAGINAVSWDAVELPSQFLENWCWHEESLNLIAQHYQTKDALPAELLEKMRAAKNFQSGMQTLRQVEFALFDMRLHSGYQKTAELGVQDVLDHVREQVAVLTPPSSNRFQNSFSHIFAGGYAAGYYSYKWSEVLSADAFGRFEEEGIFNAQTGHDFLSAILERGGAEDANDLFVEFRGREPKIDALLQQTGIL